MRCQTLNLDAEGFSDLQSSEHCFQNALELSVSAVTPRAFALTLESSESKFKLYRATTYRLTSGHKQVMTNFRHLVTFCSRMPDSIWSHKMVAHEKRMVLRLTSLKNTLARGFRLHLLTAAKYKDSWVQVWLPVNPWRFPNNTETQTKTPKTMFAHPNNCLE